MLHRETVSEKVLKLISSLQENPALDKFFLVGGTSLSLQIGHRRSDDIVLFTVADFDEVKLLEILESGFSFQMDYIEINTLKGYIDDIKVDLLSHKYKLIRPVKEMEEVRLASLQDISAMKINAISNDGTRVKDYIDIYFLLEQFDLRELLSNYNEKYDLRNPLHALKSLNYFEEANSDDWPAIIKERELTWDKVMKTINKACSDYIQSLKQ